MRYIYRTDLFSDFNVYLLEKHGLTVALNGFAHFQIFEKKMQVVYKIVFLVYFK